MFLKHRLIILNFRRFATRKVALDGVWGVDTPHVTASLSWRVAALIVLAINMNTQNCIESIVHRSDMFFKSNREKRPLELTAPNFAVGLVIHS